VGRHLQLLSHQIDTDARYLADRALTPRDQRISLRVEPNWPQILRAAWLLRRIDPAYPLLCTFGHAAMLAAALGWPERLCHHRSCLDPPIPAWARRRLGDRLVEQTGPPGVALDIDPAARPRLRLKLGLAEDHRLLWPLSQVTLRRGFCIALWVAGVLFKHDPRTRIVVTNEDEFAAIKQLLAAQEHAPLLCDARGLSLPDLAAVADAGLLAPDTRRFELVPTAFAVAARLPVIGTSSATTHLDSDLRQHITAAQSDRPADLSRLLLESLERRAGGQSSLAVPLPARQSS
jgi:hypothetical protein